MLNLTQLQTFATLARELHFTRTADALELTQPAVTQQIRALEASLGLRLVDVRRRRTALTDAGHFLAGRAAPLLGDARALEREMREYADVRAGELRLGASITIASYVIPGLIAGFSQLHPEVRARVTIGNTERIVRELVAGEISLGLVEGPLDEDETFLVTPFADDELVVVAAPSHPLTKPVRGKRRPIEPGALANVAFVGREPGSGTRAQAEAALAALGLAPRTVLTLATSEGLVEAVAHGIGIAILSKLVVAHAVAAGRLVRLDVTGLRIPRTLRSVRLRERVPSPAVNAFGALLTEISTRAGARRDRA